MLQVAAVLVRLPDLLLQLLAALVLIGQLLGQQLAALPGLAQVLQGGGGLHLHRLGDVLSRPKQSGSTKRQCVMLLQQVFFFLYLHHRLFALLAVQLQLQLLHPVLSFPQLLPSPPLALLAPSLQVGQLIGALLQGQLQLVDSAAQVFVLLHPQITGVCVPPGPRHRCPPILSPVLSHLHEHGAGLRGDGGQLLQEALGDAQVLFQALVLC